MTTSTTKIQKDLQLSSQLPLPLSSFLRLITVFRKLSILGLLPNLQVHRGVNYKYYRSCRFDNYTQNLLQILATNAFKSVILPAAEKYSSNISPC